MGLQRGIIIPAMWLAVLLFLVPPQDDAARIRELVEKLGSEVLLERESAMEELKKTGLAAGPELRKAANEADAGRATLAKKLLRRVEVLELVGTGFLREFPNAPDKLAYGAESEWAGYFLAAHSKLGDDARRYVLAREEFAGLAGRALRGADERLQVLIAINRRRIRVAVADLLPLFEQNDRSVFDEAIKAAGRPLPELVRHRLLELAEGEKDHVREWAMRALGEAGVVEGLPILTRRVHARDSLERAVALRAFAALSGDEAIPVLLEALDDASPEVLKAALDLVGEFRIQSAAPRVMKLAKEGPVLDETVWCLKNLGAKEQAPELVKLLENAPAASARWMLTTLAELDPKLVVKPAVRALESESFELRRGALFALLIARSTEPVPDIRKLLKDDDDRVRGYALATLGVLGAREAKADMVALLEGPAQRDRTGAIRALAALGAREEAEKIRARLKDSDPSVKAEAIRALDRLGAPISSSEIGALLEAPSTLPAAMRVLARLQGREASAQIRTYLRLDSDICKEVLATLAGLEAWDAAPDVARLLEDTEPTMVRAAAAWLARAGSRAGRAVFLEDDGAPFFALNAMRTPTTWKKLLASPSPERWEVTTTRELVAALASAAGLKVEEDPTLKGQPDRWLRKLRPFVVGLPSTVVDGFEVLLENARVGVILEGELVRIVSADEERRFWRAWLEESEPKK
jgi:HEAT repeat protein